MGHIIHLCTGAILHGGKIGGGRYRRGGGERERETEQREEQKWKHAGHMDVFKDHQGRETCAFSHKPR